MMYLKNLQNHNGIRKVCALVAASMILPVLAYASTDNGKGNGGTNNGNQNGHDKVPVVPETNAAWGVSAVLRCSAAFFGPTVFPR
jgi:hypothetical protein